MAKKRDPRQEGEVVTRERVEDAVRPPRQYKVLFHNDDYTTQQFVVAVLKTIFNKDHDAANRIMLEVHHAGIAVAGIYPFEIAETKAAQTEAEARAREYPFKVTVEPAD